LLVSIIVDFEPVEEGRYDLGVELRAGAAAYFRKGIVNSPSAAIRHLGNDIVESTGYRGWRRAQLCGARA
jgi:hypothetical protein